MAFTWHFFGDALNGQPMRFERCAVGKIVSAIGEKAGVVVDVRQKGDATVSKFASAHDLRRAFGRRWAAKVMPTVLRELMRHATVATTMAYYVGQDAESTADTLWSVSGNISGNTEPSIASGDYAERSTSTVETSVS